MEPLTIRELRARQLMSETDLAREARLNRRTVHRAETGQGVPHNRTIKLICGVLGTAPEDVAEFRAAIDTKGRAA